jgi:hypothetical protein
MSEVQFPAAAAAVMFFHFTTASRLTLQPVGPPIQWVQGALSLGVLWPGCEADLSPLSSHMSSWHSTWLSTGTSNFTIHETVQLVEKEDWAYFILIHMTKVVSQLNTLLLTGVGCHHWSSCYSCRWWSFPVAARWRSAMRVHTPPHITSVWSQCCECVCSFRNYLCGMFGTWKSETDIKFEQSYYNVFSWSFLNFMSWPINIKQLLQILVCEYNWELCKVLYNCYSLLVGMRWHQWRNCCSKWQAPST